MFENTCLEKIESEFIPLNDANSLKFMDACETELMKYYRPYAKTIGLFRTTLAHDFGIVPPRTLCVFHDRIRYIQTILNKLETESHVIAEKLQIIEQLKSYGLSYSACDYDTITDSFTITGKAYSLSELRRNLEGVKNAESEAQEILKDKKLMDRLVQWELDGETGRIPKHITTYTLRVLRPTLKKLAYKIRVEEEATRRIEKLNFEKDVKKRMEELGYQT